MGIFIRMGHKSKVNFLRYSLFYFIILFIVNISSATSLANSSKIEALAFNTHYCFPQQVRITNTQLNNYQKLSQNKNDNIGSYLLGLINYYGIGLAKNEQRGMRYLLTAAQNGNIHAMVFYAMALLADKKNTNNNQVIYWLKLASNAGNINAATSLAVLLYPHDLDYEKYQTQLKLNSQRFGYAQYIMGSQLVQTGVQNNLNQGLKLLKKAFLNKNSPIIIKYKAAYLLSMVDSLYSHQWLSKAKIVLRHYNCVSKDKRLNVIAYLG